MVPLSLWHSLTRTRVMQVSVAPQHLGSPVHTLSWLWVLPISSASRDE